MTTQSTTVDQICLNLLKEHQAFERELAQREHKLHQIWLEDQQLELQVLCEISDELASENDDLRFQFTEIQEEISHLTELSLQLAVD